MPISDTRKKELDALATQQGLVPVNQANQNTKAPDTSTLIGLSLLGFILGGIIIYQVIKISSKKSIRVKDGRKHWWYRLLSVLYAGLYLLVLATATTIIAIMPLEESILTTLVTYFAFLVIAIMAIEIVKYAIIYTVSGKEN